MTPDPQFIVLDILCGGGGASIGIRAAEVDGHKVAMVIIAVDIDPVASASYRANHPDVIFYEQDVRTLPIDHIRIQVAMYRHLFPNAKLVVWGSFECFPADTLILTKDGLKPIQNVVVGDKVLTHKGRWRSVTSTMSKIADTVVVKGQGHPGLEVTANHPFYTRKDTYIWNNNKRGYENIPTKAEWVEAKDLNKIEGNYHAQRVAYRWATPIKNKPLPIPPVPGRGMNMDSPNFWWLVGRWLGDGWNSPTWKGQITIVCGKHEVNDLEEKLSAWMPHNGRRAKEGDLLWRKREMRTAYTFSCSHITFWEWLTKHFGRKAGGKTIPAWALSLPEEHKEALIQGYVSADGYVSEKRIDVTTISKSLAIGVRLLVESMGYRACMFMDNNNRNKIEGRIVNAKPIYTVYWYRNKSQRNSFSDDKHSWMGIKKVSEGRKQQVVYNISVAQDESYVADGIVVHNCTNFSRAKGGVGKEEESRDLANTLYMKWNTAYRKFEIGGGFIQELDPDYVHIENVEEFLSWGPLDNEGKPIEHLKGLHFDTWEDRINKLGYKSQWRKINAADVGGYTKRTRLFGCFAKKGLPIVWPTVTHTKHGDMFSAKWKPVREILDFADEGESIFPQNGKRKGYLGDKTYRRIMAGCTKYIPGLSEGKFLLKYNSTNQKTDIHVPPSIDDPSPTVAAQDRIGVVSSEFMLKYHGNKGEGPMPESMEGPGSTITGRDRHAKISAFIVSQNFNNGPADINEPMQTIMASRKMHHLVNPQWERTSNSVINDVDQPCFTLISRMDKAAPYLMTSDVGGIEIVVYREDPDIVKELKMFMVRYGIVDIKMRMLRVHELKRIQGFPDNYILLGSQNNQKKMIGNSVHSDVPKSWYEALARALMNM